MSKILMAILALFLLFGAFAVPITDGIKGWRTDDTTQAFVVVTAAGATTANVTLTSDLYQDKASEVISISSNETEAPVATSYDSATNHLLVSALNAATTRTLTVEYYADTDSTVMNAIGPFLAVLIIGGLALATVYGVWKAKHR
jgi:anti-sigma-K factor RskA